MFNSGLQIGGVVSIMLKLFKCIDLIIENHSQIYKKYHRNSQKDLLIFFTFLTKISLFVDKFHTKSKVWALFFTFINFLDLNEGFNY